MESALLTIKCTDKPGLIAGITNFIFQNSGNIISLDQHTDPQVNMFFMRVEWELENFRIKREEILGQFDNFLKVAGVKADRELAFSDIRERMAIFVSAQDHCLYDLLFRYRSGELKCDIPVIISNHPEHKSVADYFKVSFKHVPIEKDDKGKAEKSQLALLEEHKIDFIVLARYMQILSGDFIRHYPYKIINIHHSFLPAFKGSKPYHQAYEKGVKIIGATSHFVTEELDQGPIIHQDIIKVSHKDTVEDMVIKGRDIEQQVLAEAVKLHLHNRIFVHANKTYIL